MRRRKNRSEARVGSPAVSNMEPDAIDDPKGYVLWRYRDAIGYYWRASEHNKNAYRISRRLVVILGAVLTLVASVASAGYVTDRSWLNTTFAVATPLLAALLAIITGLSQNFQWGSAWRGMVVAAQTLQKQEDRIKLLPPGEVDAIEEIIILNDVVLGETQQFFERVTGAAMERSKEAPTLPDGDDDKREESDLVN